MPAKQLAKGELTRRQIIEAAAPLFNRQGYEGTSMSDLMTATGLEKGGIYRHFDGKQQIAEAAFDYAWQSVSAPRGKGLEDCSSALEKLLLLVRNFVEITPRAVPGGCPLLNTAIDSDDGNPRLRTRARSALHSWSRSIQALVQQGQRSGELNSAVDPKTVATILIASLEGAVMIGRLDNSRDPLKQIGHYLDGFLRNLATASKP